MKTKLLRQCRNQIKLYERNGKYYVSTGFYMDSSGKTEYAAKEYYRIWIINTANRIFGFRPKQQLFKQHNMQGQYVIIALTNMDFMKNKEGKIKYYDTEDEACIICGMYEFENAWVMKLIYNHIEDK